MAINMNSFVATIAGSDGFAKPNRYQIFIPTSTLLQRSGDIFQKIESKKPGVTWDWMKDWYAEDMGDTYIELAAYCDKAELPSYQFQLETVRHYGPAFKIPHLPEYQDITLTFMCGSNMWERYFFDAWMYLVMDPYTNDFNYKDEYAVDINIVQYYDEATGSVVNVNSILNPANNIMFNVGGNYSMSGYPGRLNPEMFEDMVVDYNYASTLIDAFPIAINAQELGYAINDTLQRVSVTFSYKFGVPFAGKTSTTGTKPRGDQQAFQQTVGFKPIAKAPQGGGEEG